MRIAHLSSAVLLAGCLNAQVQNHTAHPIDELHGTFGHWTPFGALGTGGADESRCQQLILAQYLPPIPSLLTGIEVAAHFTGNAPYQSLKILAGLTTATSLTTSFAGNLPNPNTVYSTTSSSINWTSTTVWVPFVFSTPFVHDGQSNLIIEMQKVIDRPNNPGVPTISHQMSNNPMRRDLPLPLFRDGTHGSGASVSPTGTLYNGAPVLMRLRWTSSPTLVIGSTKVSGRSYFHQNATLRLDAQAPAVSAFLTLFDGAVTTTPLPTPPISGLYWLSPLRVLVLGVGVVPPTGPGTLSLTIPTQMDLVGVQLFFQSLIVGPSLTWTNVVDGTIAQ